LRAYQLNFFKRTKQVPETLQKKEESLLKSTLWLLCSNGSRLVLQAAYFIIIARVLGPDQYGAFVGATSFVAILAPFAGMGGGFILIKNVSRNKSLFREYWGNALFKILISSIFFGGLCVLLYPFVLPKEIPNALILLAIFADLVCLRLIQVAGQAFQAVMRLRNTAQLNLLPEISRLIAALLLLNFFPHPDALQWMWLYVSGTIITSLIAVFWVHQSLGKPKLALGRVKSEIKEGIYFSIGLSSQTVYNDIDKSMLTRLATLTDAGIYAAAYRLIDVSFVPVRSLLGAAYTKFFRHGANGITATLQFAKRLMPIAGGYGIVAALALFLGAPVVQSIFGNEYAGTVDALRWLAPIPFLKVLHYFAADTLTGAGYQNFRSMAQIVIAMLNVMLNLWLIPIYSWKGAAMVSIASDTLLALGLWTIVLAMSQRKLQKLSQKPFHG
jgi:O-antigen/teichoic acid export membrane protein